MNYEKLEELNILHKRIKEICKNSIIEDLDSILQKLIPRSKMHVEDFKGGCGIFNSYYVLYI